MFSKKNHDISHEYFTIFDTKVGNYRPPLLATNTQDILRQLEQMFANPSQNGNPLVTHATDFQLFKIGDYDQKTGLLHGHKPEHVANLHEIKAQVTLSLVADKRISHTETQPALVPS